ncbi:MAG: NAD(P)/FAD-dependent oxidoreductase [Candidatus Sericytochromatia bacterium]
MNYDVIVAGAGFSGAGCALMLAQRGYRVLLLEQQARDQLGKAFSRLMLDVDTFAKTGLERPQGDELLALMDLFTAFSPSGKVRKPIDFSALLLNGYLFQQRLLDQALSAGVHFEQAEIRGPVSAEGCVTGVETTAGEYSAPLTIDASGNAQVLVRALVEQRLLPFLHAQDLHSEYGVAYRLSCRSDLPPGELQIHFCMQGGYIWHSNFDVGLGMMGREAPDLAAIRARIEELKVRYGWDLGEIESEDWGKMSVRYPLVSLVADGFAVVGDAGFMINSVRGGGVSAGLRGAKLLAEVADEALEERDFRHQRLWDYNLRFQQQVGATLAYQDVMRKTLMNEPPAEMEFAFEKDIVTSEDIKCSMAGKLLEFNPLQKLQKGLRGAAHPALLMRLNHKLEAGRQLHDHFRKYPDAPAYFPAWYQDLQQILAKVGS